MAFDYSESELKPGKTVPVVLNQLRGNPVVHVEHLGEENASWMDDQLARANAKKEAVDRRAGVQLTKKAIKEARAKNREILARHAIRDLEAKHTDGRLATKDDIPSFVAALPDDVVDFLRDFAINAENFRDRTIESEPKEIAEK